MVEQAMDGRYYAQGRAVFRSPLRSGAGVTMGFCVCELAPGVSDDGADEIARALNLLMEMESGRETRPDR